MSTITINWPTEPGTYDISEILLNVKPGISINLEPHDFIYNDKYPEGRLKARVCGVLLSINFPRG
jgi:hypothetical protein